MQIGQVVGTVVATHRTSKFEGLTLRLLQPVDIDLVPYGAHILAADVVGSGEGEYVLYAAGSSARQTEQTDKRPVDAVIMAIIDRWDVGGEVRFHKFLGTGANEG